MILPCVACVCHGLHQNALFISFFILFARYLKGVGWTAVRSCCLSPAAFSRVEFSCNHSGGIHDVLTVRTLKAHLCFSHPLLSRRSAFLGSFSALIASLYTNGCKSVSALRCWFPWFCLFASIRLLIVFQDCCFLLMHVRTWLALSAKLWPETLRPGTTISA